MLVACALISQNSLLGPSLQPPGGNGLALLSPKLVYDVPADPYGDYRFAQAHGKPNIFLHSD